MRLVRLDATSADEESQTPADELIRRIRIACDDLHDDPLSPAARDALLGLLDKDVPTAPMSW